MRVNIDLLGRLRALVRHGTRCRRQRVYAVLALAAAVSALPAHAATRADSPPPDSSRAEFARPDFNGIWQALGEAHWDVEPHMARAALQTREGPHGPVPADALLPIGAIGAVPPGLGVVVGGEIPYTDAARAQRDANRADWLQRDGEIQCFLPGVPRATYMPYPMQIVQNADAIVIAHQYAGAVRDILLDDPGPAPVDAWMGQSVGHWEGETLVVEVTGQVAETWLDRSGNHHGSALKVTERWRKLGPDHIWYEATLEDPDTYTRPWTIALPLYRRIEPGARLLDFKCVEFVEELLFGQWRRNPLPPETWKRPSIDPPEGGR